MANLPPLASMISLMSIHGGSVRPLTYTQTPAKTPVCPVDATSFCSPSFSILYAM